MTSISSVIDWLREHGYALTHRRRDAAVTGRYLYVFSHPRRRSVAIGVINGQVRDAHRSRLAQVVLTDEKKDKDQAD